MQQEERFHVFVISAIDACIRVLGQAGDLKGLSWDKVLRAMALMVMLLSTREFICHVDSARGANTRERTLANLQILIGTTTKWMEHLSGQHFWERAVSGPDTIWGTAIDEVQQVNKLMGLACCLQSDYVVCMGDIDQARDSVITGSESRHADGTSKDMSNKEPHWTTQPMHQESVVQWFQRPSYLGVQHMLVQETQRFGPTIVEMIQFVFGERHASLHCNPSKSPATEVMPVVFRELTDWEFDEHEAVRSQQFFAQLASSIALEVVHVLTSPVVAHRAQAILVVGFLNRFLKSLQKYLRCCLRQLCWKIYNRLRQDGQCMVVLNQDDFDFDRLRSDGTVDDSSVHDRWI